MIEGKPTFILTMRTTLLLALPLFVACDNDSSPAGSSGSGGDPPTWNDHSVHETDTGLDFPGGCTCGAPNLGDLVVGDRWTVEGHIGDFFSLDQYDGFKFIGSETQAFLIDFTLEPLTNIAESSLTVPGANHVVDLCMAKDAADDDGLQLDAAGRSGGPDRRRSVWRTSVRTTPLRFLLQWNTERPRSRLQPESCLQTGPRSRSRRRIARQMTSRAIFPSGGSLA